MDDELLILMSSIVVGFFLMMLGFSYIDVKRETACIEAGGTAVRGACVMPAK